MAKCVAIKYFDDANTDAYGVGLWFSKCRHHCKGCQNKDLWEDVGEEFTEEMLNNILKHFEDYAQFYGNLFFSGGDPLHEDNIETVTYIAKRFKEKFKDRFNVWLWTGYTYNEIKDKEILNYIDVLIDGKYVEKLRDLNLEFRGSSNQCVWEKENGVWVKKFGEMS